MIKKVASAMASRLRVIPWELVLLLIFLITFSSITNSRAVVISEDLQIVSPVEGSVFAPGETITVVVSAAPGSSITEVGVIGGKAIGFSETRTAPPYEFSLYIQNRHIGKTRLTATAKTSEGGVVFSQSVII